MNTAASAFASEISPSSAPAFVNFLAFRALNTHFSANFQTSAFRLNALEFPLISHPFSRSSPSGTSSPSIAPEPTITESNDESMSSSPVPLRTMPIVPRTRFLKLDLVCAYSPSSTHSSSTGPPVSSSTRHSSSRSSSATSDAARSSSASISSSDRTVVVVEEEEEVVVSSFSIVASRGVVDGRNSGLDAAVTILAAVGGTPPRPGPPKPDVDVAARMATVVASSKRMVREIVR
mmetsp:Transcript_20167/g.48443  ORF Transcript_20167/g.48443 Transcript_20167/m.48443 type:complete len:234 (-) Transcript_20167:16-717(-)